VKTSLGYVLTLGVSASLVAACIDLFHSTNFETLCDTDPTNAACPSPPDAIDFCTWTSEEARSAATRVCAWFGACEGPSGTSAFGECVTRAQFAFDCDANPNFRPAGNVDAMWRCLLKAATAESCAEFDKCLFPSGDLPKCQGHDASDGSFLSCIVDDTGHGLSAVVACNGDTRPSGVDLCLMAGRTCMPATDSDAKCTGSYGLNCTASTDDCSGSSWAQHCVSGAQPVDMGVDCSGYGAGTCVSNDNGSACAPVSSESCTGSFIPTCNNGTVSACVGGHPYEIDCGKLGGLSCANDGTVPPSDPLQACTGSQDCTGVEWCNGNYIKSCSRNFLLSFDCAGVGLGPCRPVTVQGAPSINYAACSPPP